MTYIASEEDNVVKDTDEESERKFLSCKRRSILFVGRGVSFIVLGVVSTSVVLATPLSLLVSLVSSGCLSSLFLVLTGAVFA